MPDQATYDENLRIYKKELRLANSILKIDRHSAATGEWFGPHRETQHASPLCPCQGCSVRYPKTKAALKEEDV